MTPSVFREIALGPALRLLPATMSSPEADAMVVAICLQESRLTARRQHKGPARGYAQFEERGGCLGVLTHAWSRVPAERLCQALDVTATPHAVYRALEYQDVLAAGFARLLLWTLPEPLAREHEPDEAWQQYLRAWRPGRPHPATWDAMWRQAWTSRRSDT